MLAACPSETDRQPVCAMDEGLPAFPGAEGFGSKTPGGRGGQVIAVTTLADSGPGSLREAVDTAGPRIIVFRVGGTIRLQSHLEVYAPFLTIAGQTAPGGGIQIRDAGIVIFTHDVVVQHLRLRPGATAPTVDPEVNDAISVLGPGAHHVVIDHVSTSWGEDETLSIYDRAHHVTVSWSTVTEPLAGGRHEKGSHAAGLLSGTGANCVSIHHNLMAHVGFRNPLLAFGGRHDVVENVVYDWQELPTEIVPGGRVMEVNVVGNVYRPGPSTLSVRTPIVVDLEHPVHHLIGGNSLFGPAGVPRVHVARNNGPDGVVPEDPWSLVAIDWGAAPLPAQYRFQAPFAAPAVTGTGDVWTAVLDGAGATRPIRDAVDTRVVNQVRTGSGRIVGIESDVGGHPELSEGQPPPDSDGDGMPDDWETAQGLDPSDPGDGAADADGDGYTNVEEWLHSLL